MQMFQQVWLHLLRSGDRQNERSKPRYGRVHTGRRARAPPPPSAMMAVHSPHREHAATATAAATQSFKPKIAAKKPAGQDVQLAGYVQS